jgi:hypothetical protein
LLDIWDPGERSHWPWWATKSTTWSVQFGTQDCCPC